MIGSNDSTILTHLECSACGAFHDHNRVQGVCTRCGKPLLARYDLSHVRDAFSRDQLAQRSPTMWRYREVLPVLRASNVVSLGEGFTPVLPLGRLGNELGIPKLAVKDEALNPTGSFKARGLAMAASKAKELGLTELCIPTAGNAGGALAAYAAKARIRSHIYMPVDTPSANIEECRLYGADVHLVPGNISDAAAVMNSEKQQWFDVSTLKEPYRLEGKKTMGYEVAEQYGWNLPDVIVYPTGGGTGLIGMWKAFAELEALGWISSRRPKMISVQSSGCAPVVTAFEERVNACEFWKDAATIASGLRVPKPFADTLILQSLYESNGCAVAVDDAAILDGIRRTAALDGFLLSPEGAACIAALPQLLRRGVVSAASAVLAFNTGSAFKYAEVMGLAARPH